MAISSAMVFIKFCDLTVPNIRHTQIFFIVESIINVTLHTHNKTFHFHVKETLKLSLAMLSPARTKYK